MPVDRIGGGISGSTSTWTEIRGAGAPVAIAGDLGRLFGVELLRGRGGHDRSRENRGAGPSRGARGWRWKLKSCGELGSCGPWGGLGRPGDRGNLQDAPGAGLEALGKGLWGLGVALLRPSGLAGPSGKALRGGTFGEAVWLEPGAEAPRNNPTAPEGRGRAKGADLSPACRSGPARPQRAVEPKSNRQRIKIRSAGAQSALLQTDFVHHPARNLAFGHGRSRRGRSAQVAQGGQTSLERSLGGPMSTHTGFRAAGGDPQTWTEPRETAISPTAWEHF